MAFYPGMSEDDQTSAQIKIWLEGIRASKVVMGIAATALPLYFLGPIVAALAGKDTALSVKLAVGVSVGGSAIMATWLAVKKKMREQSQDLTRLRDRCSRLEKDLETARSALRAAQNR